jgi:hypothetical protein
MGNFPSVPSFELIRALQSLTDLAAGNLRPSFQNFVRARLAMPSFPARYLRRDD